MPVIVEFPHVVHAIDDMLIDHEGMGNVLWHSRSANSNLDNGAQADDRDPADAGDDGRAYRALDGYIKKPND